MEGLGKDGSFCMPRPFAWLNLTENEASSRLWKLSDCFSPFAQTAPVEKKQKDFMDSRQTMLELKDTPTVPPLLPPFPLSSLPRPSVSMCNHCEPGTMALGGGGGDVGVPHLVATSQPLSCCSGTLRPPQSFTCSQPKLLPPAPGDPCLGSLALYPCPGLSSSSLIPHLSMEHRVCVKDAHYCRVCVRKSARGDSKSLWPNIPPPSAQSAPVPVPMCNGCGVTGATADGFVLMGTGFGISNHKYGSPESSRDENLPPVGVFWDIENCSVPSGRSAVAVVQRIRSRFFKGHREAEFICVCDISKESKEVIQELNNCQVTVAHINATAKNAADDKLRQSLRRFADTHAAPATVVLVSSDINFASELSDLRHRHGFQVILVHKNQASEALLQHAHQHVAFEDFVSDLPTRMPLKQQQPASTLLYVYNLPTNRDSKSVSNRLRRLSDNCGGKVLSVTAGCAVLRFSSQEACQRAAKRMEGEDVFGSHIAVSFRPRAKAGQSGAPDPVQELCSLENKPRMPVQLEKKVRNNDVALTLNSFEPAKLVTADIGHRGRRRECSTSRSVTDSPVDRSDFHVSTPSAFSKLCLQKTFSPLVLSQGSWSPRSGSPCLSSRSSPLTAPPRSPCLDGTYEPFSDGVDIQVSNMDYRMSRKELQQTLLDTFSKHGRVKSVELSPHTDYQLKATVQMCALQQAISAVSNLHRYKIGSKRIHVSLVTTGNRSLGPLSSEVISILQDAPACCLPLFKLAEIYEKKFGRRLPLGDLYKLTEVVSLRDQGSTRLVCLLPSSQARQSPLGSSQSHDGSSTSGSPVVFEELEYHEPVCRQHHATQIFSESDFDPDSYQIPFVVLSLKAFAAQVHSLLQSHEGTVPLLSFPDCYAAEFTPLVLGEEGQVEGGIPLEHLITCVPGINIVTAQNGYKVIKWIHNKPPQPNVDPWSQRCKSPVGNPQLIQFSREVIDLLKSQPCCIMPVNKFIPSYHHHFAKQCRVSDYGYSKLLELLEAVPHVLQILGMGSKRLLTLTHRTQVKRFTQDLLKLLKFQVSKQVDTKDFMQAYHWCFSRDWKVVEYGMCDLLDLLAEIPDTTITITQQDTQTVISIPKRERTSEEMERTKQFAKEVVDLLRHQPHFRMAFSKFIPSYHHHFGRQCKLSYYGFTKLMELFEAIPDVLQVLECGEEKILTLTEMEKVKALAAQMVKLLRSQKDSSMPLSHFLSEYNKTFGYGLRLQDYDVSSVPALLHKLCHVVKVADGPGGRDIQLISRKSLRSLTTQLLALLMSMPAEQDWLTVEELSQQYESTHGLSLNPCHYGFVSLSELLKSLPYLVQLHEKETNDRSERVQLTQLYQFARSVRALLHTYHYNQIFLNEFPIAFCKYTGTALQPRTYGYNTLDELLAAIPQVVWIKGHAHKKIIVLKNDMKARVSPHPDGESCDAQAEDEMSPLTVENTLLEGESCTAELEETELLTLSSPVDLLCGPVPSCLPSPQLHPDPVLLQQADLIRFEPSTPPLKPSLADSPGRRRGRVKLAANFSLAPVTQL